MKLIISYIIVLLLDISVGRAQQLQPGDIVINEVLFNPVKDGVDFVEGYNRSNKTIDLREFCIANRNPAGDIAGQRTVARGSILLEPGKYFVITSDEKWLRQSYKVPVEALVCQISSLPSFPDDQGHVLFLDRNDTIIDALDYSEKWHFAMISEPEGVSLERIDFNAPAQDAHNWTSASSSSGFGTPGFQNSHFRAVPRMEGEVLVYPEVFSPDNDGFNDLGTIQYNMRESGFVGNLGIYDMAGRRVRYLLKNVVLGLSDRFAWDGLDDRSNPLPSAMYIMLSEMYNLQGQTKKFRNIIILKRNRGP